MFIVGLGNPGAKYERTRHNLGFMLVDLLAREVGASVKRKDCRALVGRAEVEGVRVELVKPQTYMNLSGEAVSCLLAKQANVSVSQYLIVISDDLALPFGTIRLRRRESAVVDGWGASREVQPQQRQCDTRRGEHPCPNASRVHFDERYALYGGRAHSGGRG